MTGNGKLARWQGYKQHPNGVSCYTGELRLIGGILKWPDYLNDDSAAMSLLDTLVEKNYGITLQYAIDTKAWKILIVCDDIINDNQWWIEKMHKIRREAVVAAVLEMIGKEDV